MKDLERFFVSKIIHTVPISFVESCMPDFVLCRSAIKAHAASSRALQLDLPPASSLPLNLHSVTYDNHYHMDK